MSVSFIIFRYVFRLRFFRFSINRQKSSGAEGERLKEAASINKSLSTLGYEYLLQLIIFCIFVSFLMLRKIYMQSCYNGSSRWC